MSDTGEDPAVAATAADLPVAASSDPPEEFDKADVPSTNNNKDGNTKDTNNAASYSTRGRGTLDDPLERLARQVLGDLSVPTTAPPRLPASSSFLSDAITEEERRTRTRYIPAVEGMHALRKHQIKADLLQCRSAAEGGAAGVSSSNADDSNSSNNMAVDDYDYTTNSSKSRNKSADATTSAAVFAPPAVDSSTSNHPGQVTAVTAFDPPRPPESIGSKKQHRLTRWERKPGDVENDLRTYRKTVQRTREELHRVQEELAQVQAVDAMVRQSLITQLHCLTQEYQQLRREYYRMQQECVQVAGLSMTRTRSSSRTSNSNVGADGAGLVPKVPWKDVIAVMQAKKGELQAKGLMTAVNTNTSSSNNNNSAEGDGDTMMILSFMDESTAAVGTTTSSTGVGGLAAVNFIEKATTATVPTSNKALMMASEWIVPGDLVQTPYGEGVVAAVLAVERLDKNAKPHDWKEQEDGMDIDSNDKTDDKRSTKNKSTHFLVPRIAVQLPFGMGYFAVGAVRSKEQPVTTYSDEQLTRRWKGMIETGQALGEMVDVATNLKLHSQDADVDVEETAEGNANSSNSPNKDTTEETANNLASSDALHGIPSPSGIETMIPQGLHIMPTSAGRGAMFTKLSVEELDQEIRKVAFTGKGPLDWTTHPGVIPKIRSREATRQDTLRLQGTVLQLKNQLYRQRRLRLMNERTYASTQERASRVEALVSEMRTDLKTLKRRLDEDVADLGMSEEEAERILKQYYDSLDYKHAGDVSPPAKRARKPSIAAGATDNGMTDEDDDDVGVQQLEELQDGADGMEVEK